MYYLIEFRRCNQWKVFKIDSRIQVYYNEEKAKKDVEKFSKEINQKFRIKPINVHPKIEYKKCRYNDIK